ncbi:hypothetical protein DY000_02049015 [Brassica cretica]|uniref:Uncharacterized protein n=1 Tax=Brassica cretica TaxID=69181 RepID=A0ABQ7EXC3_BRACR|nr:hypothetical protein DY000_02049015 [Brassica cretica]
MEGVPDLSALLKGKLQMLSTKSSSTGVSDVRPSLVEGDANVEPSAQNPTKKAAGKAKKRIAKGEQSASLEESVPLEEALLRSRRRRKRRRTGRRGLVRILLSTKIRPRQSFGKITRGGPARTGSTEASPEERPKKRATKKSVEEGARRSVDGDHPDDLPASEDPSRSGGKASGSEGASEKLVRTRLSAIERLRAENKKANDKAAEEKEVLRVKFEELEGKLKSDRLAKKELMREKTRLEQTAAALEKEKTELEEERDAVVETLVKERQRLWDSRIQEVTRERVKVQTAMADKSTRCFGRVRDHLARLDAFEKAKNLYGHASGMRKCLEVIRDNGMEIPQEMINIFIEQEKLHEAEVAKLRLDPLFESDLTLSPLNLPFRFVNEEFMATLDPYGSNLAVDVISAPTERVAATEEKSPEKENPETGEVLIQEGGTENVGPEDHVLVSDTSSERREDEEGESDRGEKTPSLRPNEEEVPSEVGKESTSSIPSLGVDLPALVPAQVEGPTVSAAEDPQDPPAPSVLTGNGNDQDSPA